ncbi:hypothetical protein HA41_11170 [Pantoea conspicua]|uniref:DNA methylase adenine-specific domain-containing protein n=1 Tax=Pantoea conspicua TaxID=472705 RepID=A0A1X1BVN1_9GAMM|nr:hypothetical protein HA41_11170 [Pantoea conspicua]
MQEAGSVEELIRLVMRLHKQRTVVAFGVTKREGVSLQRERRSANDNAIALLNSLPQGFNGNKLTDEQRRVLAGYSGEGGLEGSGGSQYEYYTPPFMAEGIWDLFSDYGITSGHMLEPSAGTGVFQETKPAGAMMTSAEISDTSGRINQLLHPEDDVRLGAFEKLAASVPDNSYDHAVGNVPFGDSRTGFAELDPAYRDETNVGHYFVMRTIDKVKFGGLVVLVVPNGMTDGGGNNKKLRDRVSRVAEFLGAHRMPSGTFAESGTATVVDVWVLRKHTEALTQLVHNSDDQSLEAASVLWPTFIRGKWFETEGRRFVHGETERSDFNNILVVKKDGQLTNEAMKLHCHAVLTAALTGIGWVRVPPSGSRRLKVISASWLAYGTPMTAPGLSKTPPRHRAGLMRSGLARPRLAISRQKPAPLTACCRLIAANFTPPASNTHSCLTIAPMLRSVSPCSRNPATAGALCVPRSSVCVSMTR